MVSSLPLLLFLEALLRRKAPILTWNLYLPGIPLNPFTLESVGAPRSISFLTVRFVVNMSDDVALVGLPQ